MIANRATNEVPSPCVQICRLDERTHLCVGCGRNLDEIAGWPTFNAVERLQVLERVRQRSAEQRR